MWLRGIPVAARAIDLDGCKRPKMTCGSGEAAFGEPPCPPPSYEEGSRTRWDLTRVERQKDILIEER